MEDKRSVRIHRFNMQGTRCFICHETYGTKIPCNLRQELNEERVERVNANHHETPTRAGERA